MPRPFMSRETSALLVTLALSVVAAAARDSREPPKEFRIFRAGVNESTKGPSLFDEEAARTVMAEYKAHGIDVPIDWEHAMLDEDAPVSERRAAGWFELEVREGELWAVNVRWTAEADKVLRAGEWRFFSPAFFRDEDSGRVASLINVAICNLPATRQLDALVAAKTSVGATPRETPTPAGAGKETHMTMISLALVASTLGLASTASEADVLTAAKKGQSEASQLMTLTGGKTHAEALGIAIAWKESHEEVAALKEAAKKEKQAALLKKGRESGQITGATEAYWSKQPVESLEGYLAAAGSALPTPRAEGVGASASTKGWEELSVMDRHRMQNDDPEGAKALKAASRKGKV